MTNFPGRPATGGESFVRVYPGIVDHAAVWEDRHAFMEGNPVFSVSRAAGRIGLGEAHLDALGTLTGPYIELEPDELEHDSSRFGADQLRAMRAADDAFDVVVGEVARQNGLLVQRGLRVHRAGLYYPGEGTPWHCDPMLEAGTLLSVSFPRVRGTECAHCELSQDDLDDDYRLRNPAVLSAPDCVIEASEPGVVTQIFGSTLHCSPDDKGPRFWILQALFVPRPGEGRPFR